MEDDTVLITSITEEYEQQQQQQWVEHTELHQVYVDDVTRKFLTTFNKIQDLSVRYGLKIDFPTIVVVGGQSSGKSSLVEAFLGFIFNFTQDGIATRCPLILQMENDPRKHQPEFQITDQRLLKFLTVSPNKKYNTEQVKYALSEFNKSLGESIDQNPLTLKVSYQHCANLTIGDTPGFRLLGNTDLILAAQNFILQFLSKDTIVVCVENATQDPSNFSALHFLLTKFSTSTAATTQKSSSHSSPLPNSTTTTSKYTLPSKTSTTTTTTTTSTSPTIETIVLVLNQFDKQLSSFSELQKTDIENRMCIPSSLGKVAQLDRFYTSMPEARVKEKWDGGRFRKEIEKICQQQRSVVASKNVSSEVVSMIGFDYLRTYLQREIQRKYQNSIPNLITCLQNLQLQTETKLQDLKQQHNLANLSSVRQLLEKFTAVFSRNYLESLEGAAHECTIPYRQTLDQEYEEFYKDNPTAPKFSYVESLREFISNSTEAIHGGAQYLRLLDEFQISLRSTELGKLDRDKLVNLRGRMAHQDANWLIVASKYMKEVDFKFHNNVNVFIARLRYVLFRMFPATIEVTFLDHEFDRAFFNRYGFFMDNLLKNFTLFLNKACAKLEKNIKRYIVATTNSIQINTNSNRNEEEESVECIPNPNEEQIAERVKKEMGIGQDETDHKWFYEIEWFSKQLTPNVLKKLEMICTTHFKAVRDHISNHVELIVNGFFVIPIFKELGKFLSGEVEKSSQKQLGFAEIEQEANRIQSEIDQQTKLCNDIDESVKEALKLKEEIL